MSPIFQWKNPTLDDPDEWKLFLCCGNRYHISELTGFGEIGGPYCPLCEADEYPEDER